VDWVFTPQLELAASTLLVSLFCRFYMAVRNLVRSVQKEVITSSCIIVPLCACFTTIFIAYYSVIIGSEGKLLKFIVIIDNLQIVILYLFGS
jgi:hypothetical protein